MYNPSYLVKSRHDIYYFRYPLPINDLAEHRPRRVSVSLKTRCPKQALRLAQVLAYHSANIIAAMDLERMEHAEIMSIMKSYYAEVLERAKARIDKDGQLPAANVQNTAGAAAEYAFNQDWKDGIRPCLRIAENTLSETESAFRGVVLSF